MMWRLEVWSAGVWSYEWYFGFFVDNVDRTNRLAEAQAKRALTLLVTFLFLFLLNSLEQHLLSTSYPEWRSHCHYVLLLYSGALAGLVQNPGHVSTLYDQSPFPCFRLNHVALESMARLSIYNHYTTDSDNSNACREARSIYLNSSNIILSMSHKRPLW